MRSSRLVVAIFCGLLTLLAAPSSAQTAPPVPEMPAVASAVPGLQVRWVSPPRTDATGGTSNLAGGMLVAVDAQGHPWIAKEGMLLNPPGDTAFKAGGIIGAAFLESGAMAVVRSGKSLPRAGTFSPSQPADQGFHPLFDLPRGVRKAYFAGNGDLYVVTVRVSDGYVAYSSLLVARRSAPANGEAYGLSVLKPLFGYAGEITDIAADDHYVYLAIGNRIVAIAANGSASLLYQPPERVLSLAALNDGVFYATRWGIGYVGANGRADVVAYRSPSLQVKAAGNTLYGFLPQQGAVFALEGIAALAKASLQTADIPFYRAGVQFFATRKPSPEDASKKYADSFAAPAPNENIYAELRFVPVSDTRPATGEISCRWLLNGKPLIDAKYAGLSEGWSDPQRLQAADLASGKSLFIKAPGGKWYPGNYVVEVIFNGLPAGWATFSVGGQPALADAAAMLDVARVRELVAGDGAKPPAEAVVDVMSLLFEKMLSPDSTGSSGKDARAILDILLPQYRIDSFPPMLANRFFLKCSEHAAACTPQVAGWLLQYGAGVNGRYSNGKTPLWFAIENHAYILAEWLLDHGADPNAHSGKTTPLAYLLSAPEPLPADVAPVVAKLAARGARIEAMATGGYLPPISREQLEQILAANPEIGTSLLRNLPNNVSDDVFETIFRKAMDNFRASIARAKRLSELNDPQRLSALSVMDKAISDCKSEHLRRTLAPPFYIAEAKVYLGQGQHNAEAAKALRAYLALAPDGPQAAEATSLLQQLN